MGDLATVHEQLRTKHIRTLEMLQRVVSENDALKVGECPKEVVIPPAHSC
jgi:hypothetical protein